MLKDPIKQAKELSNDKSNEKLELFQNIFDIDAADPYEDIKAHKAQKEKVSIRHIFSFE